MNEYEPSLSSPSTSNAFAIIEPLHRQRMWLKLLGGVAIAVGVLQCLTIIGAVIGWLPIWLGVLQWRCAARLELGYQERNGETVSEGLEALGKAFKLQGILTLISLALGGLYMCVLLALVIAGALQN